MDEVIEDMLLQQIGSKGRALPMIPPQMAQRGNAAHDAWRHGFEQLMKNGIKPDMYPSARGGATPGMAPPLTENIIKGTMPVAPDTRERQYAAEVDELMRLVQKAEAERMQREAEERQRQEEADVPGPFPRQDFPSNYGRSLDI